MIHIPPYLRPGDTIALVCPAGFMAPDKFQTCVDTLRAWGYEVKTGATMYSASTNYFAGTDAQRLADLQWALDDVSVKAVLCGRGGYGLSRIIDRVDFSAFLSSPKWIVGFSDVTVLHAHIFSNFRIATLHAPMAGAFNDGGAEGEYVLSLRHALEGAKACYTCDAHPLNRSGSAKGRLVGGNLSILAHLTGSNSALKTKGRILFLEDVGEYLYNIDRMLQQLRRSGRLEKLAGLVVGGFTDMKDTVRPYGASVYEIVLDAVKDYEYPVAFGFPVSHGGENYALKVGVEHRLSVKGEGVVLKQRT